MVPVKQLNEPGQKWAGRQMKPHHPLPSLRCLKLSIQFGIREGNTEKGNLDEGEGRGERAVFSSQVLPALGFVPMHKYCFD